MNSPAPVYLLAAALALTGCASSSHQHPASRAPQIAPGEPTPAAELFIHSAVYGSGSNFVDVTYRVNDLLRQPGQVFHASPAWLNTDPTPGWNRALVIVYEAKGRRRTFTTGESGQVSAEILLKNKN
jgi:hypothetical protein